MEPQTSLSNTLADYYLLPLLGLRRDAFSNSSNYCGTRLSKQGKIVVEVMDRSLVAWQALEQHQAYDYDVVDPITGTTLIVYKADVWQPDIQKFKDGRYSEFSAEAKKRIRLLTGEFDVAGKFYTFESMLKNPSFQGHFTVLLALDKDVKLRKKLEEDLAVRIDPDAELLSIPDSKVYINL